MQETSVLDGTGHSSALELRDYFCADPKQQHLHRAYRLGRNDTPHSPLAGGHQTLAMVPSTPSGSHENTAAF